MTVTLSAKFSTSTDHQLLGDFGGNVFSGHGQECRQLCLYVHPSGLFFFAVDLIDIYKH